MIRIFATEPRLNFIGKRWHGFAVSFVAVGLSLFLLFTQGLNWGIDFTGGVLMEVRMEQPADLAKLRPLFPAAEFGEVSLQHFGDEREVMIRLALNAEQDQAALIEKVKARLESVGERPEYRQTDFVGPTVGQELVQAGALATTLAVLAIVLYVWFRFEWQYSIGAVLALLHDLIVTMGFFSLTGYEFGLASVAAVLTVLGYSINDTVVIFDRIREMRRKYKKMPIADLLNKSINSTLSRTLLTAGTTLLSLVALVALGGEVIRSFAAAILFGIIAGTHSSIYVSAPVLLYCPLPEEREPTGTGKNAKEAAI